jgi:hypothetical protein
MAINRRPSPGGLFALDETRRPKFGCNIYEDSAADIESETKIFQTGVFADIADLQKLCEIVLSRTVDRMLDKPEFRAAIRSIGS